MSRITERMRTQRLILSLLLIFLLPSRGPAAPEKTTTYSADLFLFISSDVDTLVVATLSFARGREGEAYMGEFTGSLFYRGEGKFLEGNGVYPLTVKDLSSPHPSHTTRIAGSREDGFAIRYSAGDYTFLLETGPLIIHFTPNLSEDLVNRYGSAPGRILIQNKEIPGKVIYEQITWEGFNSITQEYQGLFKRFHGIFLVSEKGRVLYFRHNQADRAAFIKKYRLGDTVVNEGGFLTHNSAAPTILTKGRLVETETVRPFPAVYRVPQRWQIDLDEIKGTLHLWSRGMVLQNWIFGGYAITICEGLLNGESGEERVWGAVEFVP